MKKGAAIQMTLKPIDNCIACNQACQIENASVIDACALDRIKSVTVRNIWYYIKSGMTLSKIFT